MNANSTSTAENESYLLEKDVMSVEMLVNPPYVEFDSLHCL